MTPPSRSETRSPQGSCCPGAACVLRAVRHLCTMDLFLQLLNAAREDYFCLTLTRVCAVRQARRRVEPWPDRSDSLSRGEKPACDVPSESRPTDYDAVRPRAWSASAVSPTPCWGWTGRSGLRLWSSGAPYRREIAIQVWAEHLPPAACGEATTGCCVPAVDLAE